MNAPVIEQQISTIVEDLSREFAASHTKDQVTAIVDRWRQDIEPSAKIKDFVGVLVRRFAKEELAAAAKPSRIAV